MEKKGGPLRFLRLGILIGAGIFFLSYWWIGTITLSVAIGIIGGGGIMLAKQFSNHFKRGGKGMKSQKDRRFLVLLGLLVGFALIFSSGW